MTEPRSLWWYASRCAFMAFGALSFAVILGGCATSPGAGGSTTAVNPEADPSSEAADLRRRARIRLELAANYLEMGQTSVALDEVRQAIATDPSFGDAYNLRGLVYMRLGDWAAADENFRRALTISPSEPYLLHNYGWLRCQQQNYAEANQFFERALAVPAYTARAKTLMTQGLCQERAGQVADAEKTLVKAYELDAGNPVVGYNLASMAFRRGDAQRAQFYSRRLNNSELANAESLWLGIKIERALGNAAGMRQLGEQLHKRFPDSKEVLAFDRGAFNE
ncbi:type IV pilus biogenesis/stability protein PilW [Acidovorax sp. GBBC 3334]|uniref:type IV pilus biogenesis/stability protein PilW n=1 Tax=unclassified Acidovorax TaxID=2684926 RepID=UPI0023034F81|nr:MULTISPECIES: type IV pilus biogenesis/stability protein PilW [unclassified Acidovorax]MDA8457384.1 type IV pilus biogenesis/stability protein PilW [Acidovorax sp. GBBC 3334]MDA8519946.1 type IV pilus biogenesis/stability protein PilW [Acidovorax sp. NCPPB 4044]